MAILIFPGQGSQSPGMGKWLVENFEMAQRVFEEASDAISVNMKKLLFEGSEADLALTENTQPALLCVSTATQKVLRAEVPLEIQAAAGHSIGEYAALVAANVLRFDQAMRAVRTRGQAMQAAVPVGHGSMVATLGLDDIQANWLCQETEKRSGFSPLSPANFNCSGQVVLSGSKAAIDWMLAQMKPEEIPGNPRRVKFIPLTVSAPFHCAMMAPAEKKMRQVLTDMDFSKPEFPICQNYSAKLETDPATLRENLIRQVSAPVLWTQSMLHLRDKGMTTAFECGHGSVLRGLLKKIDAEQFKVFGVSNLEELKACRH